MLESSPHRLRGWTRRQLTGLLQDALDRTGGLWRHSFMNLRGAMSLSALNSSNILFRSTLKGFVFAFSLFVAVFSASAGYGLLKMLPRSMSNGTSIGIAEFSTHSGLTIVFFLFAGLGIYVAKKCYR
jgi:hypothetical protein